MNLYGVPLLLSCAAARALTSACFKLPLRKAVIYNCADMVTTGLVHTVVSNCLASLIKGNKYVPGWFGKQVYAAVFSFVISRVMGIFIGMTVAKVWNAPIRPFHAFEITLASVIAFGAATGLGADVRHYKLV